MHTRIPLTHARAHTTTHPLYSRRRTCDAPCCYNVITHRFHALGHALPYCLHGTSIVSAHEPIRNSFSLVTAQFSLVTAQLNSAHEPIRNAEARRGPHRLMQEGGPFGLPPSGLNRQLAAERAILRAAGGRQVHSPPGAEPVAALPAFVLQADINIMCGRGTECSGPSCSCAARPLGSSSRPLTPHLAPAAEARRSGGRKRMEHAKRQCASPASQQGRFNGAPARPAGAPAQRHRVGRR